MFILDQSRLSSFLEDVSRGFIKNPLELAVFFLLLLLFVGFLIFMYRAQILRARRAALKLAEERFEELAAKLPLSAEERDLLERLAACLPDPAKKTLILTNASSFNTSTEQLLAKEPLQEPLLHSLRLKLNLKPSDPERIPVVTEELPVGSSLILSRKKNKYPGRITSLTREGLEVDLASAEALPPPAASLVAYFQNRAGIFSFPTRIVRASGSTVILSHSSQIKRFQRRSYYRRTLMIPVLIRRQGSEEPQVPSVFLDLGGGGASLKNAAGRFRPGETLELVFKGHEDEPIRLFATVLRDSQNGSVIHVRFTAMKETLRDRIMGLLFSRSRTD